MNTTDIRNIQRDQRVFWTSSISVTVGVLTLACIYGYKGDAIQDSISRARSARSKKRQLSGAKEHTVRSETWPSMTSAVEENGHGERKHEWLRSWFHSREKLEGRRRAREGEEGQGSEV